MKSPDFWQMLSSYEEATILEARALNAGEWDQLDALSDRKRECLQRLVELGERLGLDRRNPALRQRLEAIEQAEKMNLQALSAHVESVREEGCEIAKARAQLKAFRESYAAGGAESGFYAEG